MGSYLYLGLWAFVDPQVGDYVCKADLDFHESEPHADTVTGSGTERKVRSRAEERQKSMMLAAHTCVAILYNKSPIPIEV
ncbi:hypothetical protein CEXT_754661 [Caerostris extrusa]|uniref:Uncharacterized protein n=1 Tax=Caerostris extrusa TaxID=172846 RepID=A0AAV4SC47_CAEEX|nr:hypothetical protein CEXT_754661 [Caerostris extrusa]